MENIYIQNNYKTSTLAFFAIFIQILMMMRCWIGFGGIQNAFQYILFLILVVSWQQGSLTMVFKNKYKVFALLVFFYLLYTQRNFTNIPRDLYRAVFASNIFLILSIHDGAKRVLFSSIVKWFGLLMLPGLALYFVAIVSGLPSFNQMYGEYEGGMLTKNILNNYIFFLYSSESSGRFNGPFIEPGDLGCMAAFILFAARFQFQRYKYLWVVFVAMVASQSLAGYMLATFGYMICMYFDDKLSLKYLLGLSLVILGVYLFANFYNEGDNFLQEKILSRLESDEAKGIAGNNRTSEIMTLYFFEMFNDMRTLWFGYDRDTLEFLYETGTGAGAVSKIVSVGLMGFLWLCAPNFIIYRKSSHKGFAFAFFLFFLFYMFQRTDAFWLGFVLCYVYGIEMYDMDQQNANA